EDLRGVFGTAPGSDQWAALAEGRDSGPLRDLVDRVEVLAAEGAFERAARLRDRTAALVRVLSRRQELAATASLPEIVLAQPAPRRTWAVAVVPHGRRAGSGVVPPGAAPMPVIDGLRAAATTVQAGPGPF